MKSWKLFMFQALLVFGSEMAISSNAQAQDFGYVVPNSNVKIVDRRSFSFDGWRHVRKVKIKVDGETVYKQRIKIFANGVERPLTYSNGYAYADIGESISGFEIVPQYPGAYVFGGIYADADGIPYRQSLPISIGGGFYHEDVSTILNEILLLVDATDRRVLSKTSTEYLEPISASASRCLGKTLNRGVSLGTLNCVAIVVSQIDAADALLDDLSKIEMFRGLAIGLWSKRTLLADMLRD